MFLWMQKMQILQTCRKPFVKIAEIFHSNPRKKRADDFFRKNIHPHFSSGIVKCSFYISAGNVLSRSTIFWANFEKNIDYTFFWKFVTQKRSSVYLERNFQFQDKNMLLSWRKIFAQCRKKKLEISKSTFFLKIDPKDS